MIHSVTRLPIHVPIGRRLTSKQTRTLSTWYKIREYEVGAEIVVPDQMIKTIIRESYGPMELTHVFVELPWLHKNHLYPLYVRILDTDNSEYARAHVILFKRSIADLLTHLRIGPVNRVDPYVCSIKDAELEGVISNLHGEPDQEELKEHLLTFRNERYEDYWVNDNAVILSNDTGPWDSQVDFKSMTDLNWHDERSTINWYTKQLMDVFLHETIMNYRWYEFPLSVYLDDMFNPYVGDIYPDLKHDRISRANIDEGVLDGRFMHAFGVRGLPRSYMSTNLDHLHTPKTVYPEIYSSNFLSLVTFIHSLPVREINFTYRLPTKRVPYQIDIHGASGLAQAPLGGILRCLTDTTYYWKESVSKIEVAYTPQEELWLRIEENGKDSIVHVDFTITALLSHSFHGGVV